MCYEHATSQHDFDYSFYDYICECSRWRSRHDRQHKVGECHHCPSYIDSLISWWMVLTFKIRLARSLMLSCFKNNAPCMSTQTMSPAHVSAMLSVIVKHMVCHLQCQLLLRHPLVVRNAWPSTILWLWIEFEEPNMKLIM